MCNSRDESVLSRFPERGADRVDLGAAITVVFSADFWRIEGDGIALWRLPDSEPIAVTCHSAPNTRVCQPNEPLSPRTTYRASIVGFAYVFSCENYLSATCDEQHWTFTTDGDGADSGTEENGADRDAGTDDDAGVPDPCR